MATQTLVCFGEVLWDLLPSGKVPGGAPMNVAYHASRFGLQAEMISRVGADALGRDLMAFLTGKGIPAGLVQTDHTFPTGIVNVTVDPNGSPSYEIVQPVAWDFIEANKAAELAVSAADALVFGSLACRTDRTKRTLLGLLDHAARKVFDVNLRPPFFSKELLDELLAKADIAKMNDDELDTIAAWHGVAGDEAAKMFFLKTRFHLDAVIVTKGPNGAALVNDHGYTTQRGFKVKVQDTIGSGDAFLGAFLSKALHGAPPEECLEFGCAAGAYVATQQGATPKISEKEIEGILM